MVRHQLQGLPYLGLGVDGDHRTAHDLLDLDFRRVAALAYDLEEHVPLGDDPKGLAILGDEYAAHMRLLHDLRRLVHGVLRVAEVEASPHELLNWSV